MAPAPLSGKDFLTFLSVPCTAASFWLPADKNKITGWQKSGLEIAEIRMDLAEIENADEARQLISGYSALPVILTIRTANEGGKWQKSEEARRGLFLQLLPLAAAVDIELAAKIRPEITAAAKELGKAVIFSRHNFSAADSSGGMKEAAARAFSEGADIFKTACMVSDENDLEELRVFLREEKTRPVIAIGMGGSDAARLARLELPKEGSRIAFAAVGKSSAPGQLSLEETAAAVLAARA